MDDLSPLYDRIEVLEKTVVLLLDRLNLELIVHGADYLELNER